MSCRITLPEKAFEIEKSFTPQKPDRWKLAIEGFCQVVTWRDEFDFTDVELVALADVINEQIAGARLPNVTARPKIICLCGSTRFVESFNWWQKRLTYEGQIVLSIEIGTTQAQAEDPQHCNPGNPELKAMLDELHLRKIDLCDEVMILNLGGYVGESTKKEIAYAQKIGKPISWLEPVKEGGAQ